MEQMLHRLEELLAESENTVFFGGAGVSTASGIPDFRSSDGLYNQDAYRHPPEQMLSRSFFDAHTAAFFDFYKEKMLYLDAEPNQAHLALARMEERGMLRWVITQNVDGLHQKAGSRRVLELHGSVHRNLCMGCGKQYDALFIRESQGVPQCACGGIVKPDVVLYEEGLDSQVVDRAVRAISEAQLLIIGGTSLAVYPAAAFLDYFRGGHIVMINKTPGPRDQRADLVITGDIAQILEALRLS